MASSTEMKEVIMDITKYVEIVYRCMICGADDSTMNNITHHILSNHVQAMPTLSITSENVGDQSSSLAEPTADVCSEPEVTVEDSEVSMTQLEPNSDVGQCMEESEMQDTEHASDRCEGAVVPEINLGGEDPVAEMQHEATTSSIATQDQIIRKSERTRKIIRLVRAKVQTSEKSLHSNSESKSPDVKPSRSKIAKTEAIKEHRDSETLGRRVIKPPRSYENNKSLIPCTEIKQESVDHVINTIPKIHTVKKPEIIHVIPQNFVCSYEYCSAKFSTVENLNYHRNCHNNPGNTTSGPSLFERMSRCAECFELFPTWNTLQLHLWEHHEIDIELVKCTECAFRTDSAQKLRAHQSTHSAEMPHCCRVCGQGFKDDEECVAHMSEHKRKREVTRVMEDTVYNSNLCDTCGRQFTSQNGLRGHIQNVHEKKRPMCMCPICGNSTSRYDLKRHMRTHTGEKPLRCNMCDFQAGNHKTLRRHKATHGEESGKSELGLRFW